MAGPANSLFELMIRVRPGPGCEMPAHLIGADVPCFVSASDHLTAVRLAVEALRSRGYVFEDLVGQSFRQLDPSRWDEYLQQAWGDLPSQFPEQAAAIREQFPDAARIRHLVSVGGVAFGPLCCWESET